LSFTPLRAALIALGLAALPGMTLAQTCPDYEMDGAPLNYDADVLAQGQTTDVMAGGDVDLGQCLDLPGSGFVALSPDFDLALAGAGTGVDLQLSVTAACDATVLVNDYAGEWHFADDADGSTNPRLVITGAQDGNYDIWVGTFDTEICDASLTLQTFAAGTAPMMVDGDGDGGGGMGMCPDAAIGSAVDTLDMTTLGTPRSQAITAGGGLDLGACPDVPGAGYIIEGPDLELSVVGNGAGLDLEIRVDAVCDTVILVNDSFGEWQFVDDAEGGLNPVLVIPAAAEGVYDLWVGTIGPDVCEGTLSFTALGGAPAPGGKGGGTAAPVEEAPVEEAPAPGGKGGGAAPAEEAPVEEAPVEEAPVEEAAGDAGTSDLMTDPGNMAAYRADVGMVYAIEITGSTDGFVWGNNLYTDDSDVSTAAVHAGVVAAGETAVVLVEMTGPQTAFDAADSNGVASSSFGSWGGSFVFVTGE
jgi:hypothetical protein